MDTSSLKKFAQSARIELIEQVGSKLAFVLKPESPARREYPSVVNELEKVLAKLGKEGLIDQVAYTWFNRFCALRFMDVNGYNRVGVVSPAEGQVQPEILAEAKSGVLNVEQLSEKTQDQIRGLLGGSIPSTDAQGEAYRLLIVGSCNALYERLPYLFERISDYTELLMPDDLLSESSILAKTRSAMTTESCQDVEVIGWLYQFYISEKKDAVFEGLKKNQKITPENIPAATQLFTPHWIVQYLVENSLGRLWMLNRRASKLSERMEYYIAPEEAESDFLEVSSPTELRVCDPAVGSGHMLTYAFDLLYAIYEEEGYDPNDIPGLILTHNLYGIEIDERAGALASFALDMKAAKRLGRRRFFRMDVKPQICVLENIMFEQSEMDDVVSIVGRDLYTADLRETLTQFEHAKNFGSLIVPQLKDPTETARLVETKDLSGDLLLSHVHQRLLKVLEMSEYLSCRYHVVIANPPYMGGKGMNGLLAKWLKDNYADVKSDLFSAFIYRLTSIARSNGELGILAPYVWMFISSYQKLREFLFSRATITSLIQLEYNAFEPAMIPVAAFTLKNGNTLALRGGYIKLSDFKGHKNQAPKALEAIQNHKCGWFYRASAEDFGKIPGSPVAYWLEREIFEILGGSKKLGNVSKARRGLETGDNERFVRYWFEVNERSLSLRTEDMARFRPYHKGGEFQKWFPHSLLCVDWRNDGGEIKTNGGVANGEDCYFKPGITWSGLTSGAPSFRLSPSGFIFDSNKGPMLFPPKGSEFHYLGLLNSSVYAHLLDVFNPTLSIQNGDIDRLPAIEKISDEFEERVKRCVEIIKEDHASLEIDITFTTNSLTSIYRDDLSDFNTRELREKTEELRRLEELINQDICVSLHLPATSGANSSGRFSTLRQANNFSAENWSDWDIKHSHVTSLLSYAVGCMFGRYSLDEPGLILANQGESLADYLARIPEPTFMPDDDNVIPMIDFDGDWFEDDITERFKQFLRVTFGDEHYGENVTFIEDALGKSLQKYFVKDFYNDHVKRYKKRPIYWLFSSPKGTFNALIYMHRYTPSTVSVVLNEYLREFRTKLEARRDSNEQISISGSASQKEKTDALKMIDKLNKALNEVNDYERDALYPLAGQNIAIDLDDGVKQNYPLFGSALKKIAGLS